MTSTDLPTIDPADGPPEQHADPVVATYISAYRPTSHRLGARPSKEVHATRMDGVVLRRQGGVQAKRLAAPAAGLLQRLLAGRQA